MKTKFILLLLSAFLSFNVHAEGFVCKQQYLDGVSPIINAPAFKSMARPLCYSEFSVMHSGVTRTPLWSAQYLTKSKLSQPKIGREDNFHEELAIPATERATLDDYRGSGYDRGHLTPNGDLPDRQSKNESFSLANIVPQNSNNNQVLWEGIEKSVRGFVKNRSDSYIITGVLFLNGQQKIRNRVSIPSHVFKVVYSLKDHKGGVYLATNTETMEYKVISIAELERLSSITYLPTLSQSQKSQTLELPPPQINKGNRERFSSQNNSKPHHTQTAEVYRAVSPMISQLKYLIR